MTRNLALLALIALTAALCSPALRADQPSPEEVRLRETLKSITQQLRDAQNNLFQAQATQAEDEQKITDLTAQTKTLTDRAIADKDASDKTIADMNAKNAALAKQLDAYVKALAQWESQYKLVAAAAKTKEAERLKLTSENILLQRRVDDLQTKNTNLFQIGNEILTRYEKFGLGEALAAKEPFVGLTRVKLENQVQDYQDKLLNQKSVPPPANPAPAGNPPVVNSVNKQNTRKSAPQTATPSPSPTPQASRQSNKQ